MVRDNDEGWFQIGFCDLNELTERTKAYVGWLAKAALR